MPVYPVVHKTTSEQKEVEMSIHDWDQWKSDNPDWIRDWSDPSTCPQPGEGQVDVSDQSRIQSGLSDFHWSQSWILISTSFCSPVFVFTTGYVAIVIISR